MFSIRYRHLKNGDCAPEGHSTQVYVLYISNHATDSHEARRLQVAVYEAVLVSCCATVTEHLGSTARTKRYGGSNEKSSRALMVMRGVIDPVLVRSTSAEAFGTSGAHGRSHRRLHKDIN